MARRTRRPKPTSEHTLTPAATTCVACGHHLYNDYASARTVTSLAGVARYTLRVRRCHHRPCDLFSVPSRPEAEGRLALPHHEFGLDVVAFAGNRRYAAHRTAPEIHAELAARGVTLSVRTVTDLLHRFDELRALAATDPDRMRPVFQKQGRVVLAIDGLQPDVGHEVLWVGRDVLSGRVVLARTLLSACRADLAALLARAAEAVGVPVAGVRDRWDRAVRTNNELEQLFGSHRHHERRCSGRKVASPGLVVRGSVRLVAGLMTRSGEATADELAPTDVLGWQELRAELGYQEAARAQQRRFRRDPAEYLKRLENQARQSGLPA